MRVASGRWTGEGLGRSWSLLLAWFVAAGGTGRAAGPAPLPKEGPAPEHRVAPRPHDDCGEIVLCDYASGAGCPAVGELAIGLDPFAGEKLTGLEAWATGCRGPWEGNSGCYELHIRREVDELVPVSTAIGAASEREMLLPDAARTSCAVLAPARAQEAIDEAPAWCVVGRDECVAALREARRVLDALPSWMECVERMGRWSKENARRESERLACENAPDEIAAPEPSREPVRDSGRDSGREPVREPAAPERVAAPKRVVTMGPGRVRDVLVPNAPKEQPPGDELADTTPPRYDPEAPDTTMHQTGNTRPEPIDDQRRDGQVDFVVAPFSGVLTLRDPGTGAEHRPMTASIGLGVDVVLDLSSSLALELGLAGRASFGSTALEQAVSLGLDELAIETGTAFMFELEPTAILLSQYVGFGIVAEARWDTIGVTSATTGLVSTKRDGAAGGMRFVLGLGLLEREMRLVGSLDWIFVGSDQSYMRAQIEADLHAFVLTGAYRQHYRLGGALDAHIVDDMQLSLGYRVAF